jgi:phenylacetate-CoA ligase
MTDETRLALDGSGDHFQARSIDHVPALLEKSYELRYQVYCLERKFLPAENYVSGLEIDEFDRYAIHVGAIDARGELAGTARAVTVSELGLPLFRHCTTFPHEMDRRPAYRCLVEVGRLAVSRTYRRRVDDHPSGGQDPSPSGGTASNGQVDKRRRQADVLVTVLKALYQATKRIDATHWLAAMEPSLERLLAQHGFPFRVLGPQCDYFGLVAPYLMDLKEFDQVMMSGRFPAIAGFVCGLEARFAPRPVEDRLGNELTMAGSSELVGPVGQSGGNPADGRPPVFGLETEVRLLRAFRRAAAEVPAYRTLLGEHAVGIDHVADLASFSRSCPVLSKHNTFSRFPLDQLSVGGRLRNVADVLTSSGHGGRFAFGVVSRRQALSGVQFIDRAFDDAFDITSRRTLTINCLPMGVIFSSRLMTVATTSVREDMALALVEAFGHHYDQIVLVGDPLFLKRLTDFAAERRFDWKQHRVNVLIGEETFGERFREYLAACLGLNADQGDRGYVMSSFGVGELGLHLCYETPATISLRRAARTDPSFAFDLLGVGPGDGMPLPMIFSFDPLRMFIEIIEPDELGYGRMTISMLDPERMVPLLRYQTGDIACLLDQAQVAEVTRRHDLTCAAGLPEALLALRGRETEALPNGSHVGFYKDALYDDHQIARHLTGAFRLIFSGPRCTMHVQLAASPSPAPALLEQGILNAVPARVRPEKLVLWAYAQFPFGVGLDYERKFSYYGAAEQEMAATSLEPPTHEYAL